jgi:hypothetical protein
MYVLAKRRTKKFVTLYNNFFDKIQVLLQKCNLIFTVKILIKLKQEQINI